MKKILILLLCIFFITICSCNEAKKEEPNVNINTTYDNNTNIKNIPSAKIQLKKGDSFNGNINIKNTIYNTVLFQKIDFSQTVDLNFTMNVLNATNSKFDIEVTFKDCIINSVLKEIDTPEIINPFKTLTGFAESLNGKSFTLETNRNGKVLNISDWTIDRKYTSDPDALNEINKYFSKDSLAMIFEKITYTGPESISKDNSWDYLFSLNSSIIPIQSRCTYNCVDINDYYYVIDVENSQNSVAVSSNKIIFPQINGNAKIKDYTKGSLLISKNKGILKRGEFLIDCDADIRDLTLLNLKFPVSVNLTPLTIVKIELNIPLI